MCRVGLLNEIGKYYFFNEYLSWRVQSHYIETKMFKKAVLRLAVNICESNPTYKAGHIIQLVLKNINSFSKTFPLVIHCFCYNDKILLRILTQRSLFNFLFLRKNAQERLHEHAHIDNFEMREHMTVGDNFVVVVVIFVNLNK